MCHHGFLEISFVLTCVLQGQYLKSSCLVAVTSSNLNNILKGTTNVSVVLEEAKKLPEEECGMQHG